jgi:hypothetical protein
MARARLITTAQGTALVRVFRDDDAGLLQYRNQNLATGFMVSVGRWLHVYQLQDARGFQKLPHYTYSKTNHKVCAASRADFPALIGFILANLETPLDQVQWGASGAAAADELEAALHANNFSLTADGHIIPGVMPHQWRRHNIE